jgi:hypothetical protein
MRRFWATATAVAVMGMFGAASPASAATKQCGNVRYTGYDKGRGDDEIYKVRITPAGISCKLAKAVIRNWFSTVIAAGRQGPGVPPAPLRSGYKCRPRTPFVKNHYVTRTDVCRKGSQTIVATTHHPYID